MMMMRRRRRRQRRRRIRMMMRMIGCSAALVIVEFVLDYLHGNLILQSSI
jgi:hypothetical protein